MKHLGLALLFITSLAQAQVAALWERARPVIERHCVRCHMPAKLRGGLDLSSREALLRGGKHGQVVDLAAPQSSRLLASVRAEQQPRMPYKEDALGPESIAALEAWVAAGVPMDPAPRLPRDPGSVSDEDRAFWSFGPLRKVQPPPDTAAKNPVDAFLLAELQRNGLSFAAPAPPTMLLRRAHLLLTGLPPAPEEVLAFAADTDAQAWPKLIERLLARPQFGERMARHWLDVARYADSNGYEFDEERAHAWPYRDFVVKAFNDDMPADQFVRWQLAGDELDPANRWARAATGFLAAGPVNSNEENEGTRYTELDDVLSTTCSAFLGLSMACARCHDHKFDPLPTADYYGMLAAFVTARRVESVFAETALEQAHAAAVSKHEAAVKSQTEELRAYLEEARARPQNPTARGGEELWRYTFEEPSAEWLLPDFDDSGWKTGPGGFGTAGTPGALIGTEWNGARIWMRRAFVWDGPAEELALVAHHDDSVHVYLNGTLAGDARGYSTDYKQLSVTDFGREKLRQGSNVLAVFCTQDAGGQFIDVRPVRHSRLKTRSARELALEGRATDPDAGLSDAQLARRDALVAKLERTKESAPRAPARVQHFQDHSAQPDKAWLLRRGNPEDKVEEIAFLLPRVLPGGGATELWMQQQIASKQDSRPSNGVVAESTGRRAAMAAWITDTEHGAGALLARVMVNRVWQWHFGVGLVATSNDFGLQGARPSHPELLEWLAGELVRSHWSLKHIHRLLSNSMAWRQSGTPSTAAAAQDSDGSLLSHRRLLRLDGEALRDCVLAVSASLNLRMGGPAVKPWVHSDAIATGSTEKWPKAVKDGPETWRRSVYVFMRRSVRFPFFECFDAPDAQASCGVRVPTVTPLQSLALMNNEFIREQARLFARRVEREAGADAALFVERAFLMAFARSPTEPERQRALEFLRSEGSATELRASLCQALFGANAFLYVE
ncbi:MAG: DUF1553 domain-containing protein [Planctomycetes bacterium]|nr:DUF1553 domain-containing protein [Planctomycetota bacterium]